MIDAADRARLPPPSEDEEDTLDLAFGVTSDSRLGCQIKLTAGLEGMRIRLTSTM
jgi:ferredoxin